MRYGEIPVKDVKQEVEDDILNILLEEKKIVKVTDEMYTLSAYMDEAKEKIRASLAEDPVITIRAGAGHVPDEPEERQADPGVHGQHQGDKEDGRGK